MTDFEAIVVGAGIHGLCTAFWLRQRGLRRVLVLERFGAGHRQGSSHGGTRITRSSYHEADLVHLAARANRDAWPAVERALGRSLRVPTPGVFFGPARGPFAAYVRAARSAGAPIEVLAVTEARARFPLLRFHDDDAVLLDHTAAMLLAADAMAGLRAWLEAEGTELRWHAPVLRIEATPDAVRVHTAAETLRAPRVVVAAGPWLPHLVPPPAPLVVLRQQVGYFDLLADARDLQAGVFPVWARIGEMANDFQYGLPSVDGGGVKAAQHVTVGDGADADAAAPPVDEGRLVALARARFCAEVVALRAHESCLYTMAPDQRLHVATAEHDRRIVLVAACSGHGFKFGPVVGQMAAALAVP